MAVPFSDAIRPMRGMHPSLRLEAEVYPERLPCRQSRGWCGGEREALSLSRQPSREMDLDRLPHADRDVAAILG